MLRLLFHIVLLLQIYSFGKSASPFAYYCLDSISTDSLMHLGLVGKNIGMDFRQDTLEANIEGKLQKVKVFYGKDEKSPEGIIIYPFDEKTFTIIGSFKLLNITRDSLTLRGMLQKYDFEKKVKTGRSSKIHLTTDINQIKGIYKYKALPRKFKDRIIVWGAAFIIGAIVIWQYKN